MKPPREATGVGWLPMGVGHALVDAFVVLQEPHNAKSLGENNAQFQYTVLLLILCRIVIVHEVCNTCASREAKCRPYTTRLVVIVVISLKMIAWRGEATRPHPRLA